MFRRNDLKLLFLLCLVVILLFLLRGMFVKAGGNKVVVTQNGKETAEYSLSDHINAVIRSDDGGSNTLHIENGTVWISDASCPDKTCEHQGKISKEGEMIVCLPNRLSISITE